MIDHFVQIVMLTNVSILIGGWLGRNLSCIPCNDARCGLVNKYNLLNPEEVKREIRNYSSDNLICQKIVIVVQLQNH